MNKINVLMCGSKVSVKGGMSSVIKNYLGYSDWEKYNIIYVPTHLEKAKPLLVLYFITAYLKIFFLLLTKKIKIAHFHTAERGSFYRKSILVKLCKTFGVKTIMHHHAAEFEKFYLSLSKKRKAYVSRILELTDVNIVLSQRLIPMIKNKAPKANVKVLYNAVTTSNCNQYNTESSSVLFLGRLGERKGIYDLLQAIFLAKDSLPVDTKFYICGDGEIQNVKDKIKEMNLTELIAYVGWVDGQQKKEIFNKCCLNVLPSYNEGLPMTILETMSHGIPNISTNIASIPEVIKNGRNGYLIEPGDIVSLSNLMIEVLKNKENRILLSKEAFKTINMHFSLNANVSKLIYIYDDLIKVRDGNER